MTFVSQRPPREQRRFASRAVDDAIARTAGRMRDRELAWLFANCLPNTLDTTVEFTRDHADGPDTFVLTGDIPAMWLRDSTAQVWPYLVFGREDPDLRALLAGVIRRQAACVRLDAYANAFYREAVLGQWRHDHTLMRPGVHERKWEVDSLLYFFRLAHGYWQATHDLSPFDAGWKEAVKTALSVLQAEQAGLGAGVEPAYTFARTCDFGDSLANGGRGDPARRCGLVRGAFRPSDDQTKLPYHIASNAMAVPALLGLADLLAACAAPAEAAAARGLSAAIAAGLAAHGLVLHRDHGEIWAYEVDGFGGAYLMDDANVPSLLALPYLGFCRTDDPRYRRTRAFVLSADNPYFVAGRAARGLGSPHTGLEQIWPIGLVLQALTATDDGEILSCLRWLRDTHAGTGFMHESFHREDPARFSRPWFAWANTLFGELILTLDRDRPHLLAAPL